MSTIRANETRRIETPNATMTTLASPTQGSAGLSLWRVEMAEGARGPVHSFDSEQVWTLEEGKAEVTLDDQVHALAPGDTLVLPAGRVRQVVAVSASRFVVCGHGAAVVQVVGEPQPRGTPPWIA